MATTIRESFLAFKWTLSGNRGLYQRSWRYGTQQDGKWHEDPKLVRGRRWVAKHHLPPGSGSSFYNHPDVPQICRAGWHALSWRQRNLFHGTTLWIVELFGTMAISSTKLAASEIRWVDRLSTAELEGARQYDNPRDQLKSLGISGLVLVDITPMMQRPSRLRPQLLRIK